MCPASLGAETLPLGETVATSRRFEWRAVTLEGAADLVAQLPLGPEAARALDVARRRIASLRDDAPELIPPLVAAVPGESGLAALVHARAPRASLAAALPLDEARALALGGALARLLRALDARGLALDSLSPDDLLHDPATGRTAVTGLARLRLAAGREPRVPTVAWGALLARVLGAEETPSGFLLEGLAARGVSPATASLVRDALRGDPAVLERGTALLERAAALAPPGGADAPLARALRERASRGLEATLRGPLGLTLLVLGPTSAPATGEPAASETGVVSLAAVEASTGALVQLRTARLAPGASLEAVRAARARVEADFEAARRSLSGAVPLVRFRAPALDAWLARSGSPELRRDEAYALSAWGTAAPAPALRPVAPLERVSVSREGASVRIALRPRAAGKALLVRARPGEAVLVPADGEPVFRGDVPEAGTVVEDEVEAGTSPRYAAFALGPHGEPSPALHARLEAAAELGKLSATSGVGKVLLRWEGVPAGARAVVVRTGSPPPASPEAGELAFWGLSRSTIEVAGEPGAVLHARAFVLRADGTFSRGLAAEAEVWGPPEPVTALAADASQEARVRVTWQWPARRERLTAARLRREPALPSGDVALDLAGSPGWLDDSPPLGIPVKYEVVTDSLGAEAVAGTTTLAWAELPAFTAEGAGEAVALAWTLPPGAPADATVRVVRRLDRAPADLDDGDPLSLAPGSHEHLDQPLPAGTVARYRAGLVLASGLARSPGRTAEAAALEKAGALANLVLASKKKAIEVRWDEPPAGVDDVALYAGPLGKDPVAYDRAAFLAGKPVRLEPAAGVLQRIKAVPKLRGREDASGQIAGEAVAWDEVEGLRSVPGPGTVEILWSAPPSTAEVVVRRRLDVKDSPWQELPVPAGATSAKDEPPKGKGCVYKVSLRFTAGGASVESEGQEVKETARELPPELGTPAPRARTTPGAVVLTYFEPRAKVNYTGVVVYESARSPADVEAAFRKLGREHHLAADLPALGLDLAEVAQKDKNPAPKVDVELPVRDDVPRPTTLVVATRNGPVRRVHAVLRALRLPGGALALRVQPDEKTGKPRLEWSLPRVDERVKLSRLELRRALNDPDQEIPAKEKEKLEAPFSQALAENATSFTDVGAEDGVTFAYTLAATFDAGADRFEVASQPASVRGGRPGGKLGLAATQARGMFGFKKPPSVEVTVKRDGGAGAFPAFQVVRSVEGTKGEVVAATFDGGEALPPVLKDEDLAAFTPGMTLVYTLKLTRYLDARRVEVGSPAKVKLG